MHNGIVDSNSGPGYPNPSVRPAPPPTRPPAEPVTVLLDKADKVKVKLAEGGGEVSIAIHDPKRCEADGETEVWAITVKPDRAEAFGLQLVALARTAGLRAATAPRR